MGSSTTGVTTLPTPLETYTSVDTSADATLVELKDTSGWLGGVFCDNSSGTQDIYVCAWDLESGSVTLGTTVPNLFAMKVEAGKKCGVLIRDVANNKGLEFSYLTVAVCTGLVSNTSPTIKPVLQVFFS